jgi:hypothetical protein
MDTSNSVARPSVQPARNLIFDEKLKMAINGGNWTDLPLRSRKFGNKTMARGG